MADDAAFAGISLETDPDVPPGTIELRSGETRLRTYLADAAADYLWRRFRTDPAFAEEVRSLTESKDYITYSSQAGEAIQCESCGTLVAQVPERLIGETRPRPGIWEPMAWRRHTLRRCDAMRELGTGGA